jgi:hypothetical protein
MIMEKKDKRGKRDKREQKPSGKKEIRVIMEYKEK